MILGAAAGVVALGAGMAGSWAICAFVLSTDFQIIWPNAAAVISGGLIANILAGLAFALKALNASPAEAVSYTHLTLPTN